MADNNADPTIVQALGIVEVEERHLKDSGWEDDLVFGRRVIRVNGRRTHRPSGFVHRLVEPLQVLLQVVSVELQVVLKIFFVFYVEVFVLLVQLSRMQNVIGEADHVGNCISFLLRQRPSFLIHPVELS